MMYAREAAVKSRPTPPQVMVVSKTLMSGSEWNARRTLALLVEERDPSSLMFLMDLFLSCVPIISNVFVHEEKTTL